MRRSPAYKAVQELRRSQDFPFTVKEKTSRNNMNYLMLELPDTHKAVTIGGKTYHSEASPHLSIYEHFKSSETQGLSIFHYTWFGTTSNANHDADYNDKSDNAEHIVLHVYFSRSGSYLYSQAKNRATEQFIDTPNQNEESLIRRKTYLQVTPVLEQINIHIYQRNIIKNQAAKSKLEALEKISVHIKTQTEKYIRTAKECIKLLEEKNEWSFKTDGRIQWLSSVVTQLELNIKKRTNTKLFKQKCKIKKDTASKNEKSESAASAIGSKAGKVDTPTTLQIKEKLAAVDREIQALDDQNATEAQKAVEKMRLLESKVEMISGVDKQLTVDEQLDILQAPNLHQNEIIKLFEQCVLEDDLEDVKTLSPYIDYIDPIFFTGLIRTSHAINTCEYLIQHFDECIHIINCLGIQLEPNSPGISLLHIVLANSEQNLPFFSMLLRNGANPNFHGTLEVSLLTAAVQLKKLGHIRAILEHGADLFPKNIKVFGEKVTLSKKTPTTQSAITRIARNARNTDPNTWEKIDGGKSPFAEAIMSGEPELVQTFLDFNPPLNTPIFQGFNAIGVATFSTENKPNPAIVQLLVEHGADIDSYQITNDGLKGTALNFAVQRDDSDSARLFIQLGADPNKTYQQLLSGEQQVVINATPFFKACNKGHFEIARYMLEQQQCPVDFYTFATTCSFSFKKDRVIYTVSEDSFVIELDVDQLNELEQFLVFHLENHLFDHDDRTKGVQKAGISAKLHFAKKEYSIAINYFFAILIFGTPEQRHNASYNIGCCFHRLNDLDKAKAFYDLCQKCNLHPDSANGARLQLEKIEGATAARSLSNP